MGCMMRIKLEEELETMTVSTSQKVVQNPPNTSAAHHSFFLTISSDNKAAKINAALILG